ncbi:hypothetical protein [Psychrobacter immobilis]|uniref:hypothetical protein n=1 Tax=Psychrobacter immobilis TaxID=498 RepID=UPI001918E8D2|nr:hypothetical protein [Psychrobacter immobilis]
MLTSNSHINIKYANTLVLSTQPQTHLQAQQLTPAVKSVQLNLGDLNQAALR